MCSSDLDIVSKIIEICEKHKLTYIAQKSVPLKRYYSILLDTKLFISSYGWGEFSLKNYECICFGCHVLKSEIYFESYPNYYANMDSFKIDLSDLEDHIINALKNLDTCQSKVDKNRELFLSSNTNIQIENAIKLSTIPFI